MSEASSHHTAQDLIDAVEKDDEKKVKSLIEENVDVNYVDGQGRTALLCAVQNNVDKIIEALVDGGARVNARDRYDRSSLFYAITKSKDTFSYLFEKASKLKGSIVSSILSFFIQRLCERQDDSHPTIDEVLSLPIAIENPKKLAKAIVNILLCKLPLLLPSNTDSHRQRNPHPMFLLHGKRKILLDILNKVSESENLKGYEKNEELKKILKKVEITASISEILNQLKEHKADPCYADMYGNTAFHYAACLPWMGVPEDIAIDMCESLREFEAPLDKKNHQGQTPLLFCLAQSMTHLQDEDKVTAMKTLVQVCQFLVNRGSSLEETTRNGESVFHLIMKLFQQGFDILDESVRQSVTDETLKLLELFSPDRLNQGTTVNKSNSHLNSPMHDYNDGPKPAVKERAGESLNSPLHVWASLVVPDYTCKLTKDHTFEELLEFLFEYLFECGANTSDTNTDGETRLHVCKTWSAVTLLIAKDVQTDIKDSRGRLPLLAAASKGTFCLNPSHFYPDFKEDADSFYKTAVEEKKLDPWTVDKCNNSVLSYLISSEEYILSRALVDFACKEGSDCTSPIFVSLLIAICKDESLRTRWKVELVRTILKRTKEKVIHAVQEPFNVCCQTMLSQWSGKADDKPPPSNNRALGEANEATTQREDVQEEPAERNENHKIEKALHCDIAKLLRWFGAELSGEAYEKLKSECEEIEDILENTEVQILVPWTSISKRHQDKLEEVAKRQECQEIGGIICCHKSPMGSYGHLFVGINKLNSKEVTVKQICIKEAHDRQEMRNLYAEINCEQIIRYDLLHFEDVDKVYIAFELMEGNLEDYVGGGTFDPSKGASLCGDILNGLNYLHKRNIRHFQDHLKPTSVFYKTDPQLPVCLKITDFDNTPPSIWSSPEVLRKPECPHRSESSDMFPCGLLMHYILTKGKHPFCPTDCSSKSESDIVTEMRSNIMGDDLCNLGDDLSPEAAHLLQGMLHADEIKRPSADKALNHPFFWTKDKKMDLLIAVGNQPEFEYPRAGSSALVTNLEAEFGAIVNPHAKWNDPGDMPAIYKEMTSGKGRTSYRTKTVVELVRFIRNARAHVSESTRPTPIRKQILEDFVFLEYFPNLVMEVFKAVTTHGWDQAREEIKSAMKK